MSPLWRDSLRVALRPDGLALVRIKKGLRPGVLHKAALSCASSVEGQPKWQGAVDKLASVLQEDAWRGANVTAVLSTHFVRYFLIPGNLDMKDKAEEKAFAAHLLARTGEDAERWDIRVSLEMPGKGRVACAVEKALLAALEEVARISGGKLVSVAPYLMSAFNSRRGPMAREDAWFIALERDFCIMGRWADGQWRDIKSHRLSGPPEDELPRLLGRESLLSVDDDLPEKVVVFSPENPGLSFRLPPPWRVVVQHPAPISNFSPSDDRAAALAME